MGERKKRKRAKTLPTLANFEEWADLLRTELKQKDAPDLIRREQPSNVFKVSAYRYRRKLERAKLIDGLRTYVLERDVKRWDGGESTPSLWVLRLAAMPRETAAVRKRRSRLAASLELAALNKVRPELLLGFLYEVGPSSLTERNAEIKKYGWAKYYRKTGAYDTGWDRKQDPEARGGQWD